MNCTHQHVSRGMHAALQPRTAGNRPGRGAVNPAASTWLQVPSVLFCYVLEPCCHEALAGLLHCVVGSPGGIDEVQPVVQQATPSGACGQSSAQLEWCVASSWMLKALDLYFGKICRGFGSRQVPDSSHVLGLRLCFICLKHNLGSFTGHAAC